MKEALKKLALVLAEPEVKLAIVAALVLARLISPQAEFEEAPTD